MREKLREAAKDFIIRFFGLQVYEFIHKIVHYVLHEPNPLVQIFYLILIFGGYGAFLFTGRTHLPNEFLGESHVFISFVAVMVALHSFISASTMPPGIFMGKTLMYYDNYDYDNVLYTKRDCSTCKSIKLPRSKHCSVCNICVPRFDHHCVWINSCVGENNHFHFLRFLLCNMVFLYYGAYVLFYVLYAQVKEHDLWSTEYVSQLTGEYTEPTLYIVVRFLMFLDPIDCLLLSLCVFMGLALTCFVCFHIYLVSCNLTTNEFFKWRALKRKESSNNSTTTHYYDLGSMGKNIKEVFDPRYERKLELLVKLQQRKKKHTFTKSKEGARQETEAKKDT